jgi:hypothetical protein
MKQLMSPKVFLSVIGVIALLGILGTYYFYNKYQQSVQSSPSEQTKQTQELVDKIGRLMVLPSGVPTVATVTDIQKLKNQAFFANAQNGDKVLIYPQVRKAILFDPQQDKIIEVGPINFTNTQGTESNAAPTQTNASPVKIAIYNGTTATGSARQIESRLKRTLSDVTVVAVERAARLDYDQTMVIDLTGTHADSAKKVSSVVNGEISDFPETETRPTADLLVIVGKNTSNK